MKAKNKMFSWIFIYIIGAVLVVAIFLLAWKFSDFFRTLFTGSTDLPLVGSTNGDMVIDAAKKTEAMNKNAGYLSAVIFVMIFILQLFAFLTASIVFNELKHSTETLKVRFAKLENADIFLDLPLYFGLLGTVSSFIIMSFNPNISRLIAYSSTLVGIIISVLLRLILHYPLKQKLIYEREMLADLEETRK